jgi:hypothetical protein
MATRPGDGRPSRDRRPGRAGRSPKPLYKPKRKGGGTTHKPGTPTRGNDCCPMVAALHSVKRGKLRLARRYALMSVRLMLTRGGPDALAVRP